MNYCGLEFPPDEEPDSCSPIDPKDKTNFNMSLEECKNTMTPFFVEGTKLLYKIALLNNFFKRRAS